MSTTIIEKSPSEDGSRPSANKEPNAFDKFVGDRIRRRRSLLGMSQQKLAELVGVSFQQIQKYEIGQNRLGPERLLAIARVLGVPITFLLDERAFTQYEKGTTEQDLEDFVRFKDGAQLARAFGRIADRDLRRTVIALVASLSGKPEEPAPSS